MSTVVPDPPTGRPGLTLVELLFVMAIGAVVMVGAVVSFSALQQNVEQQDTVQDLQDRLFGSVDRLVRSVRSADSISTGSTSSRLVIVGGMSQALCADARCEIEAGADGLIASSPGTGTGEGRLLAPDLTLLEMSYGLDTDGDGAVGPQDFGTAGGTPEDILGVRLVLALEAAEGRGSFRDTLTVHAAVRSRILDRLMLDGGT
jgi:prepilin-type N-terminal cleavage/methylation domain-containing protein